MADNQKTTWHQNPERHARQGGFSFYNFTDMDSTPDNKKTFLETDLERLFKLDFII
jgi:hypothetical protein